ncbi:hypothetical protein [Bacillus amyloliquefaciens]|uniref:hypothetical protein n=1 Tax=Bacillus amyloliquefaciens TaxID=1390 RepID=UPI001ABE3105|nr:hypothetical protein [Bacillus amyloliquefaciens]QTG87278.1 hypothetical protein J4048_21685 [Bacillus amyloliquefaciens]
MVNTESARRLPTNKDNEYATILGVSSKKLSHQVVINVFKYSREGQLTDVIESVEATVPKYLGRSGVRWFLGKRLEEFENKNKLGIRFVV